MKFVMKRPFNIIAKRIAKSIKEKEPEFYDKFEEEYNNNLFK